MKFFVIHAQPDAFVVRGITLMGGIAVFDREVPTAPSLELARALVPAGLRCSPRSSRDEAHVVETWL